jgi:hypothetical protein
MRQLYWQLILPSNEHVLLSPNDLTSEFIWNWSGFFWQREPTLQQAELEHWVGSQARGAAPSRANQYLFSTVGNVDALHVSTVRRSLIVFVASLTVLLCGLALIYVPAVRHPLPLVLVLSALVTAAIAEPETTLLLSQAAGLGLALLLVAFLLASKSVRRKPSLGPASASMQPLKDRSATELYQRSLKGGPSPSTATAPMAMQTSGPEEDA